MMRTPGQAPEQGLVRAQLVPEWVQGQARVLAQERAVRRFASSRAILQ